MLLEEKMEAALKAFYLQMNETATEIGMRNSSFASAHGMHHTENFSTAHDIAILARYAVKKHPFLE